MGLLVHVSSWVFGRVCESSLAWWSGGTGASTEGCGSGHLPTYLGSSRASLPAVCVSNLFCCLQHFTPVTQLLYAFQALLNKGCHQVKSCIKYSFPASAALAKWYLGVTSEAHSSGVRSSTLVLDPGKAGFPLCLQTLSFRKHIF